MHTKKIFFISLFSAFILSSLYWLKLIINLRNILTDIITFNAAILAFLMVFFTILQSLQNSDLIKKMETFYPKLKKDIFSLIKNLLMNSLFLFIYIIIIKITPNFKIRFLKTLGVFFLFFMLAWICSGLYFLISDLYSTIIQSNEKNKSE